MIDFVGIDLIEFHGIPIDKMAITEGSPLRLEVDIKIIEEGNDDYVNKTLVFGELEHLNPQIIPIEDYSDTEIFSFDYYLNDGLFFGKMTCLTGFANPSFEVDFSCRTVEINNTKSDDSEI